MLFRSAVFSLFLSLVALAQNQPLDDQTIATRIGDIFEKVFHSFSPPGSAVARRPVFAKAHGCVKAQFTVDPNLAVNYRIGVFQASGYPAWIRFSSDGPFTKDSRKAARGMSIKLVGVPGQKILPGEEQSLTQDFVMENHPVFFVDTAQDFLDFTSSSLSGDAAQVTAFNKAHPETNRILDDMDKNVLADPLDGQYWTPTPYQLGGYAIKYMVKPCTPPPDPSTKPMTADNYLRENLNTHMQQNQDICMDFWVQVQKDPNLQPIDRATVLWDEKSAPFVHFAQITIPHGQNVNAPARDTLCENLSFTGWHALPEHTPLGSINLARKVIYKRLADVRRKQGGVSIGEPTSILEEQ